jgi:23S rRNA (cytidine1920-2'-O)/16S rRNA (cytidine1409-2'-O)-methyltransferase
VSVIAVAAEARARAWGAVAVTTSALPGPAGNVEYFLWLRRGPGAVTDDDIRDEVARSAPRGSADERL